MAWTDEMVEELKRLWAEGVTTGEIGRRLNISKNSIVGKVHRLGLSGRPSPIKKKTDDTPSTKTTVKEKNITKKKDAQPAVKKETKESSAAPKVQSEKTDKKTPITPKAPEKHVVKPIITPQSSADDEADIKLAQSLNMPKQENKNRENISLTDLDNHTCRWPLGDPKDENFHFCGKKVRLGQTYCEEHAAIAYVKPNKK